MIPLCGAFVNDNLRKFRCIFPPLVGENIPVAERRKGGGHMKEKNQNKEQNTNQNQNGNQNTNQR